MWVEVPEDQRTSTSSDLNDLDDARAYVVLPRARRLLAAVFPQAIVQACVIHLIRATLRYASRKYWDQLAKDLRAIYTAPTVEAAWAAFEELEEKWGKPYPAIPKLWRSAWEEFTPFLAYDVESRRVLFSTNAIESLNARYRRAVNAKGHSRPSRRR